MKRWLSLSAAFLLLGALMAHGQVRATLAIIPGHSGFQAGSKLAARLTLEIEPGWHIASLTQPDGGPAKTEIAPAKNQPFKFDGPITGPKPKVEHSAAFGVDVETHEGTAVFTLPLEATTNIAPGTKLVIEFTYQACSEETCLPLRTEALTAVISPLEKSKTEPADHRQKSP